MLTLNCYQNLNIKIVGTGAGLSYARLGTTHHSLDDIALLRTIPDLNMVCPSDGPELSCVIEDTLNQQKPTYIRIGKKDPIRK